MNFNLFLKRNQQVIDGESANDNFDLTAKNEELEASFGIPMIICANKMDSIELQKDEKMVEHL